MIRFAVANSVVWNLRLESDRRVDNLSNFSEPQFRESVIEHRGRCGAHNATPRARNRPLINTVRRGVASRRNAMTKGTIDFARQTTEQAAQTTDWMRAIAEQNLNQSKAAFEGLLTIARSAVSGVDQQAAFMRDSMSFAEETLENTFDFAHKLVRMKEPQEFTQ